MASLFMLAPLEDVSDNAFRELCFRHGADLTFTEMTRLAGLVRHNKSTERKIELLNDVPTQIQIAAQKEDELKTFLKEFEPTKGFRGINFNIGCPSPQLIKLGLGCAMVKRVSKVNRLVKVIKDHGYTCSIKMRLGLNLFEKKKKAYVNLIRGVDADFFIVHARHGAEHYEAKADHSVFAECISTGKDIIANGDIDTVEKVEYFKSIGAKGIMIGRGAVRNHALFERFKGLKETSVEVLKKEYSLLSEKYNQGEKYRTNVLKRLGNTGTILEEASVRG